MTSQQDNIGFVQGENMSLISLLTFIQYEGVDDQAKGVYGGIVILARWKFNFIREHENFE